MLGQILEIKNYAFSVYSLPLFFACTAATLMGGYVLFKIHASHHGFKFFLFTSALSLWYGSFGMACSTADAALSLWWFKLGNIGVILIPITNYSLISAITLREEQDRRFIKGAYLISFLFILSTLFSSLLIKGLKWFFWGYYPQYGLLGAALIIFFGVIVFKIFHTVWTEYKGATTERARKRLKGLMFGIPLGYLASVDFIPTFGFPLYPFGYLPVVLFIAIMTYIVIRFQLVDITPQTAATQILKTMQGPLIVVNLEERMRVINNAACLMFGYRESEMLDKELSTVLDLPEELRDHRMLLDHPVNDFQVSFVDKQRNQIYLSLSASVLTADNDVPSGIVYVALDITKHKELEAALAKSKDDAETLVKERTAELSETVSHLRNEIEEKMLMELALKKASEEWRITFDSNKDIIIMLNSKFEVLKANRAAVEVLELSFSDIVGNPLIGSNGQCDFLNRTDLSSALKQAKHRLERELFLEEKGLSLVLTVDPIFDQEGVFAGAVLTARDVSDVKEAEEERRKLQSQLMQIQKMESIGRLTGGIAHDFNNVLTAILGFAELALYKLADNHPARDNINIILDSAQKGATLVRQLLAFSRKQILEMKVINVNKTIDNMEKMLYRLIGEDIQLVVQTRSSLRNILADGGQLEQVVMNLVVNARDAMPSGGRLTIETAMVSFDEEYARNHEELKPGPYVMLSVTDTGEGISLEIRKKIFEPFFTTKPMGKGTGLGLSTVYGIVKQHNGYIDVISEHGRGTTFKIYLPVVEEEESKVVVQNEIGFAPGMETILVVDDEPYLRKLLRSSLSAVGYLILEASSAEEALRICEDFEGKIDLLLTDVILPGMDGKQLAERFYSKRPKTKVVFISGYTDDILAHRGILGPGVVYIAKPITPTMLSRKVRQVLDDKIKIEQKAMLRKDIGNFDISL
jgi:PAS domain S-box-containing protein